MKVRVSWRERASSRGRWRYVKREVEWEGVLGEKEAASLLERELGRWPLKVYVDDTCVAVEGGDTIHVPVMGNHEMVKGGRA